MKITKKLIKVIIRIILFPFSLVHRCFFHFTAPCPVGLWILNVIVQRIFRINGNFPFMVHYTSRVSGRIKLGKGVNLSMATSGGCYIQGVDGIEIGDDTIFAWGIKIISANHALDKVIRADVDEFAHGSGVKIGRHVWLGTNVVILPGVTIGDHAVIGAGSVVTKDIPERAVAVGVPAVVKHFRDIG